MKIKSAHILILIGIISIFIIGYFVFQSLNKKNNPPFKILNTNSIIKEDKLMDSSDGVSDPQFKDTNQIGEANPDAASFSEAYAVGDHSICEEIKSESSKLLCDVYITNSKAKLEKNIKLCKEITDESYRADCHDNMIIFFAQQEKNKQKCDELIDKKRFDECLYRL